MHLLQSIWDIYSFEPVVTGHSAVLHGCTVEDEAFIGMGATVLDGVVVEKHALVAAGALVRQNTRIPSGEVYFWVKRLHYLKTHNLIIYADILLLLLRQFH